MRRAENDQLNFILWRLWDAWHFYAGVKASITTRLRFAIKPKQEPHNLPGELVISLTSYPARYKYLELTLKALMTQNMKPDRVTLWLAEKDIGQLPENILALKEHGLEIYPAADIRSFTKLVPALEKFPNAYIVTADDDVYYSPDWLGLLVKNWNGKKNHIVGHNGFYFALDENGLPPYPRHWDEEPDNIKGSVKYFSPLGESGILYPPHSLHPDVTNAKLFTELSPKADDFWFYWMAMIAGAEYSHVKSKWVKITWPLSQGGGLFKAQDIQNDNDRRIANLIRAYGFPRH